MPGLVAPRQAQNVLGEVVPGHLLGDRRDPHQPGLAPVALDVELTRVAEATEDLQGAVARCERRLGTAQLGRSDISTAAPER